MPILQARAENGHYNSFEEEKDEVLDLFGFDSLSCDECSSGACRGSAQIAAQGRNRAITEVCEGISGNYEYTRQTDSARPSRQGSLCGGLSGGHQGGLHCRRPWWKGSGKLPNKWRLDSSHLSESRWRKRRFADRRAINRFCIRVHESGWH